MSRILLGVPLCLAGCMVMPLRSPLARSPGHGTSKPALAAGKAQSKAEPNQVASSESQSDLTKPPHRAEHKPRESAPRKRLTLDVAAPARRQVGSNVTFELTLHNQTAQLVEDVVVTSDFDAALVLPGDSGKSARRILGALQPDERRPVSLVLTSDTPGRHTCRFSVTAGGTEVVWKEAEVEFVVRAVDVSLVGPLRRTVGSQAEYTLQVVNVAEHDVEAVGVTLSHDAALESREATAGVHSTPGRLVWQLGTLRRGEGVELQAEFACRWAAEATRLKVEVIGRDVATEQADARLDIAPSRGILDVRLTDTVDPVVLGGETELEVRVQNLGLQTARGLRVRVVVPTGWRVVSTRLQRGDGEPIGSGTLDGSEVVFEQTGGMLKAGDEWRCLVTARALRPGSVAWRAIVTHEGGDDPVEVDEPTFVRP